MKKVVGIRFRSLDKPCYFDSGKETYCVGDNVICKTIHGLELGKVQIPVRMVDCKSGLVDPEYFILRTASEADIKQHEKNLKSEESAAEICKKSIKKHNLSMNLIYTVLTLDKNKLIFFFTANERVDFRALVKELASIFHMRIELRQVGSRDQAKMLGGLGICGKSFCCSTFLKNFHPISIKMAKEQNLSLNSKKISGCCERLMCCLQYEYDLYKTLNKSAPKPGTTVMTPVGKGVVVDGDIITEKYSVKLVDLYESTLRVFNKNDLKIIDDPKNKNKKSQRT